MNLEWILNPDTPVLLVALALFINAWVYYIKRETNRDTLSAEAARQRAAAQEAEDKRHAEADARADETISNAVDVIRSIADSSKIQANSTVEMAKNFTELKVINRNIAGTLRDMNTKMTKIETDTGITRGQVYATDATIQRLELKIDRIGRVAADAYRLVKRKEAKARKQARDSKIIQPNVNPQQESKAA